MFGSCHGGFEVKNIGQDPTSAFGPANLERCSNGMEKQTDQFCA
jgi:hypothetical protein